MQSQNRENLGQGPIGELIAEAMDKGRHRSTVEEAKRSKPLWKWCWMEGMQFDKGRK